MSVTGIIRDLLGVWTHRNNSSLFGYIGQFWKYLQINKGNLTSAVLAGDFNSSAIWDSGDRWWNHSDVVEELSGLGIKSVYHQQTGEMHGKESIPTLYFQKKISRPYHIDYVFSPEKFLQRKKKIEIGKVEDWLGLSDHMPILYEFDSH